MSKGILAKGRNHLKKHFSGSRLTRGNAILAKCYDCMGGYSDGRVDCRIQNCPLYPFMPYRGKNEDSDSPPVSIP